MPTRFTRKRNRRQHIFCHDEMLYPFLEEAYERTGRYVFDRYWWTGRQAGCHLFRIGELEYEIICKRARARKAERAFPSIYRRMRTFHRPVWTNLWLRQNTFLQNMIRRGKAALTVVIPGFWILSYRRCWARIPIS